MAHNLTTDRLHAVLDYDAGTGIFRWKVSRNCAGGGTFEGKEAGYVGPRGYRMIGIDGNHYPAGRLAWFYVHGVWPPAEVDFKNNNFDDNRIKNLRPASRSENLQNTRVHKDNVSGLKGVTFDPGRQKYQARICVDRKQLWLGRFETAEEASAAYRAAALKHHAFAPA